MIRTFALATTLLAEICRSSVAYDLHAPSPALVSQTWKLLRSRALPQPRACRGRRCGLSPIEQPGSVR